MEEMQCGVSVLQYLAAHGCDREEALPPSQVRERIWADVVIREQKLLQAGYLISRYFL